MATALHVYDFDNTLFRSPERPDDWPLAGWWGRPESLAPPIVPADPGPEWWVPSVVSACRQSSTDPDVYTVVLTGRLANRFTVRVKELLRGQGIRPDEVILSTGGDTKSYKLAVMGSLLDADKSIGVVEIWEDRLEHLQSFVSVLEGRGFTVVPHPVRAGAVEVSVEPDPARVARRHLSRR